jgi:hypothetical protein
MKQDELNLVLDALKQCNAYAFAGGLGLRATAHTDALAILEKALAQEKALQALHSENERLGLYKDAYQPERDIAALVEGMEVSIDVSTGDHDSGNRLFGVVDLVQENQGSKHDLILLVQEPKANFKEALAQQEKDYERGFVDGMQKQMQSSVDKAVNRMAQPEQEAVLIDGVAYTIPSKVAAEILGLHLDLLQLKQEQEQEQEPVAWRTFDGEGGYDYRSYEDNESYADDWNKRNPKHVGWVDELYTHSQRTWVGLTDEERSELVTLHHGWNEYGKAIEAELKEKNNA